MVAQVVKLRAKLELHPFLREGEILYQGDVLKVGSRLAKCVTGENAIKRSIHREFTSERCGICNTSARALVVQLVDRQIQKLIMRSRIRQERAGFRYCTCESRPGSFRREIRNTEVTNRERLSCLITEHSADFPAAQNTAPPPG